MNTRITITGLAVAATLALSACSASDEATTTTPETAAPATTPDTVPATTDAPDTVPPTTAKPTVPPTTISEEERAVVSSLLLISQLEANDPAIADWRQTLADLFTDGLRWDRVNLVGGSVTDEFGPVLIVDATSGYSTREFQIEEAVAAVDQLAKGLWGPDMFGATTPSGNGSVSFQFIADGVTYNITGAQMRQIYDLTLSAADVVR